MYDFAEDAFTELEERDREREMLSKALDEAPPGMIELTNDMEGLHITVIPNRSPSVEITKLPEQDEPPVPKSKRKERSKTARSETPQKERKKRGRPRQLSDEERKQRKVEKNKEYLTKHPTYFKEYTKKTREKKAKLPPKMKHEIKELDRKKRYIIVHGNDDGFVRRQFIVSV